MPNSILTDRIATTAQEFGRVVLRYPFLDAPVPDKYSLTLARAFEVKAGSFVPTNADRTSYTNLLLQSNTFANATWTKTRATAPAVTSVVTPDGTASHLLTEDATVTNTHFASQAVTYATGTYVAYLLAKAGTRSRFELQMTGAAAKARGFDLSAGTTFQSTIVAGAPDDYGISAVGGGWYLCWIKYAITSGTSVQIYLNNGTSTTYSGDGTSGLYVSFANLVLTAAFGPIIPTTTVSRLVSSPVVDLVSNPRTSRSGAYSDPFSYLVTESDPQPNEINTVERFVRTYARIPGPQLVPSSLMLTKPALPLQQQDQIVGDYYLNRPNAAKESYDAYVVKDIVTDSGAPTPYPTGGTYTLVYDGDSTGAIAYNASAGTVQTALNALASVTDRGGLTVTGTYNSPSGLVITFNPYAYGTFTSSLTSVAFSVAIYPVGLAGRSQVYGGVGQPVTGGTFTVTIFGQTTASIAWNASEATVAAAFNALSEVSDRGGVTVTFPNGAAMASTTATSGLWSFLLNIQFLTNPVFSYTNSLSPAGSLVAVGSINPPIYNLFAITFPSIAATARTFGVIAHGISNDDTIFLSDGTTYYAGISGNIFVVDDNTFQVFVDPSAAYLSVPLFTQVGRRTKADYKPGTTMLRCLLTTLFYLPGVSVGIDDYTDIPIPTSQSDTDTFLQAVFAGSGTLNWNVGEIMPWMGPILQQTTTTIEVSEV